MYMYYQYERLVRSLEDSSQTTQAGSNVKTLSKAQVSFILLYCVCSFSLFYGVCSFTLSLSQIDLTDAFCNYLKASSEVRSIRGITPTTNALTKNFQQVSSTQTAILIHHYTIQVVMVTNICSSKHHFPGKINYC